MNTFGPPKLVLVRGEGSYVWDDAGKRYLDGLGGLAVNSLGHAHPALISAVNEQMKTLGHISNFFASPPQIELAEHLLALSNAPDGSRVFFTNSGTEANEAAVKMSRRVPVGGLESVSNDEPASRTRVLALENAFHGRSMGSLALTYKAAYREPFEPLPGGVEFVPVASAINPFDALRAAFDPALPPVAALFVEPIQGEAGVRMLPPGYLSLARELTAASGALLVFDEIQTGVGRTGSWFAHQNSAVTGEDLAVLPDVMTLAKGLGGGFPIGAVLAFGPIAAGLLQPGQHGTTFGGNPVAAAAGNAVVKAIGDKDLLANARNIGDALLRAINSAQNPAIDSVRGSGLLLAVQLTEPIAADVVAAAQNLGLIVNAVAPDAIRLAPPLNLSLAEASEAAEILNAAISQVASHHVAH
jgi:acetylornithine aminotransferase